MVPSDGLPLASAVHIAIPAMDECEWLPRTMACLEAQETEVPFDVQICVNQPESWWQKEDRRRLCEENAKLLRWLAEYRMRAPFPVEVIDCSSPGRGWQGKHSGVGWARKTLFDRIMGRYPDGDLLVSLDADTTITSGYIESVACNMASHREWVALSVPYYHRLTGDERADRAVLRYEIYLRSYALNLLAIGSPYAFTAVGSAIVARVGALRKIGGITPVSSGEDFYLLQKLRKMGEVGTWNAECVYPAARFSDRVPFGTGPAMLRGAVGDWESYPIYDWRSFAKIGDTYRQLDRLYEEEIDNDFIRFLRMQFKCVDLWGPLRKNSRTLAQFRHSFHEKADGLRILQFLRYERAQMQTLSPTLTADAGTVTCPGATTNTGASAGTGIDSPIPAEPSGAFPARHAHALDEMSMADLRQWRDALFQHEMTLREMCMRNSAD